MRIGYHLRRLADFAGGMRLSRELISHERWPHGRLREYQQERLNAFVRHATEHSPFYRELLSGVIGSGPVELECLPVLDKTKMMEHFDEIVTDPRLRRDEILAWVERMERDELYLGEYRAMTTSGSSGRKGLFVYDAAGWRAIAAMFFRQSAWMGVRPRLPRRFRIALIGGAAPSHMTRQGSATLGVGVHRFLGLPLTLPIERIVETLNRFSTRVPERLPFGGHASGRGAGCWTVERLAKDDVHEQRDAYARDDRATHRGLRRASLRSLRDDRGTVGRRMRAPRRHPHLRGCGAPRERRRRRAARARR